MIYFWPCILGQVDKVLATQVNKGAKAQCRPKWDANLDQLTKGSKFPSNLVDKESGPSMPCVFLSLENFSSQLVVTCYSRNGDNSPQVVATCSPLIGEDFCHLFFSIGRVFRSSFYRLKDTFSLEIKVSLALVTFDLD